MLSPKIFAIFLCGLFTHTILALPFGFTWHRQKDTVRQIQIDSFAAKTPLPTAALLAGDAEISAPTSRSRAPRVRNLQTLTGETGLWVSLEDLRRESGNAEDNEECQAAKTKSKSWWVGDDEI